VVQGSNGEVLQSSLPSTPLNQPASCELHCPSRELRLPNVGSDLPAPRTFSPPRASGHFAIRGSYN